MTSNAIRVCALWCVCAVLSGCNDGSDVLDGGGTGGGNGGGGDAGQVVVVLDTPPVVSLAATSLDVSQAGAVTLIAVAVDETQVNTVEFYEGATKLSEASMPPYAHVLSFSAADNGTHVYVAKASDGTGHTTTSAAISVVVHIASSDAGAGDAGPSLDAGFGVDAGSAVDAGVDAGTGSDDAGSVSDAGSTLDAGSAPDTTAPVVSLGASANTVSSAQMVTFTVTASDNVGIAKVELWDGFVKVGETATPSGTNQYTFTVSYTVADNGVHRYFARAFDAVINSGTSSPLVLVNVVIVSPSSIKDIAVGNGFSYVLKNDGTVYGTGANTYSPLGSFSSSVYAPMLGLSSVSAMAAHSEGYTGLFALAGGTVVCLGNNMGLQCAQTTPQSFSTPQLIAGVSGVVDVSTGGSSCARKSDGTVACWSGFQGSPVINNTVTPTQVVWGDGGVVNGVDRVVGCSADVFVRRTDGTLYGWGRNDGAGWVGGGFTSFYSQLTPVPVKYANNSQVFDVVDFACGNDQHVFAVADGGVFAFGLHSLPAGTLGNTTAPAGNYNAAIPVTGLSGIVDVACGRSHCLALDANGTVWAWGDNASGQLGTGSTGPGGPAAVQVAGLSNIRKVAAGGPVSLALSNTGALYAWGLAASGTGVTDAGTNVLTPRLVAVP